MIRGCGWGRDVQTLKECAGNAHSFIKVRGSITVPLTSWKTGLDMAVVDKNKNFLYKLVRPAFWEVDGMILPLTFLKEWGFPGVCNNSLCVPCIPSCLTNEASCFLVKITGKIKVSPYPQKIRHISQPKV